MWIYENSDEATTASSTFLLREEKDDQKNVLEDKDLEVIGQPIIKYGDSTVIVQHTETGLWLSYKVILFVVVKRVFVLINDYVFLVVWNEKERRG